MNLYTIVSGSKSDWVKDHIKLFVVYDNIARLEFLGREFVNCQGDQMEAYLFNQKEGSSYVTDDSLTLRALEEKGADLAEGGAVLSAAKALAAEYGLELSEDLDLVTDCSEEDFAERVQALAECMKKINELV